MIKDEGDEMDVADEAYDRDPDYDDDFDDVRPGCLFPSECCMPGPHYTDECHTPEMLDIANGVAGGRWREWYRKYDKRCKINHRKYRLGVLKSIKINKQDQGSKL